MDNLKKLLTISAVLFFIIATIGIFVAIYLNTSLFKTTINLACQPEGSDIDFSLSISKNDNTVVWNSAGTGRDRKLDLINDSIIKMSWYDDDKMLSVFTLNRLTGNFNLKIDGVESRGFGQCYKAEPKF